MKKNLLSIIALAVSAAAIILVICRIEPLVWDWMAILVGILSLLVTILLGWQLYQILNINKIEEKLKKEVASYKRDTEEALLLMYYGSLDVYKLNGDTFNFINISIHSIGKAMYLGSIGIANNLLKQIITKYPNGIEMTSFQKSMLSSSLYHVKGWNKLENYRELERLILEAKVTEIKDLSQLDFEEQR